MYKTALKLTICIWNSLIWTRWGCIKWHRIIVKINIPTLQWLVYNSTILRPRGITLGSRVANLYSVATMQLCCAAVNAEMHVPALLAQVPGICRINPNLQWLLMLRPRRVGMSCAPIFDLLLFTISQYSHARASSKFHLGFSCSLLQPSFLPQEKPPAPPPGPVIPVPVCLFGTIWNQHNLCFALALGMALKRRGSGFLQNLVLCDPSVIAPLAPPPLGELKVAQGIHVPPWRSTGAGAPQALLLLRLCIHGRRDKAPTSHNALGPAPLSQCIWNLGLPLVFAGMGQRWHAGHSKVRHCHPSPL